jgi:hypothetical protein
MFPKRGEALSSRAEPIFYADQPQILVKLDNARSQSLRTGRETHRIIA